MSMPLNSPLTEVVVGSEMPTSRQALHSASLKTCALLHQFGALTDILIEKMDKEENYYAFDQDQSVSEYEGVGSFSKSLPTCFVKSRPFAVEPCFPFELELRFTSRKKTSLGILTTEAIPPHCFYPLTLGNSTGLYNVEEIDVVTLSELQLTVLGKFHEVLLQRSLNTYNFMYLQIQSLNLSVVTYHLNVSNEAKTYCYDSVFDGYGWQKCHTAKQIPAKATP